MGITDVCVDCGEDTLSGGADWIDCVLIGLLYRHMCVGYCGIIYQSNINEIGRGVAKTWNQFDC